ncbi:glycosyltransferase, partial [Sinomonas sp. G460-2]|uniref:glycosyltransferase n=1 Tax=Sinomonas sp. G460-2 TaxID=3393464 RepID=UPI0039F08D2B
MLRLTARPLLSRPHASRLLVSVVVPCYNYGRYLPAAVASALDQPGIDVEVIIVDDASTDGSADVAERLAATDSRVTLVRHERNQGHIATYNDGLARVAGELVVLLSADDLLAPGALTRAAALFEARPEVGLVYGRVVEFSDASAVSTARIGARGSWTIWRGREWIGLATWRGRNFILSPEAVVRTSALRRAGGYNPELPHSGDLEYWLRVAAGSAVGRINGPVQAFYRVHGGNMHALRFASAAADLRHRVA